MMAETDQTRSGSVWVAAFILLTAMGLYVLLDLAAAVSLNPIISAGFALAALALGLLIFHSLPARQKLLLVGLLVTAVFSIRFINWDNRKTFLRDFYQIQPGMTAEEVDQLMADYIKNISPFVARSAQGNVQTGAVSYQYAANGVGDSDIGMITFAGGRVIARTFYPD